MGNGMGNSIFYESGADPGWVLKELDFRTYSSYSDGRA